jgi:cystathionine beta-lyase
MPDAEFDPYTYPVEPAPPQDEPVPDPDFETLCAHLGERRSDHFHAAAVPIYQTSTFVYPDADAWEKRHLAEQFEYTRVGNPTNAVLNAKLARLERGSWCFCTASGMGAISSAVNACVHSGAHIVSAAGVYWPTQRYFRFYLPRFGVQTTFVDSCDPADYIAAIRDETKLIYLESPTSAYMQMPEIPPIVAAARERGIPTIFDNSWASPYFQNPLDFGIDIVVHSATKYIGGHTDVVAGVIAGRDERLKKRVFREIELLGPTLDPFGGWLLIRGLRTLKLRMEQHQRSGLEAAKFLEAHPAVRRVWHPGLERHPQYGIGRQQLRGYSGLFSFELADQSQEATHRFMNRSRLFSIGVSWGGYESLVVGGTLFSKDPDNPTWLIRLSVGLESTENLIADLEQALES